MSLVKKIQLTCPHCGEDFEAEIWETVNTSLDPDMFDAVRRCEVFKVTCPRCGESGLLERAFLYNQMQDNYMLHFLPRSANDEEFEQILRFYSGEDLDNLLNPIIRSKKVGEVRIVRTIPRFLEKLAILDAGLDDRVVEIEKLFTWLHISDKNESFAKRKLESYFVKNEEKDSYLIVFVDLETEEKLSAPFSQKLYDAMFQIYGQEIRNSEKPDVIVDENWARQFLEKSRQEPHQES